MTAMHSSAAAIEVLPLVCPSCRAALHETTAGGLHCAACGTDFPPRAGIRVLLPEAEWRACRVHLDDEAAIRDAYARARREAPLTVRYFDWWIARMLAEIPADFDGAFVELMCGGAEVCRRLPARFTAALALDLDVDMAEPAALELAPAGGRRARLVGGAAPRPRRRTAGDVGWGRGGAPAATRRVHVGGRRAGRAASRPSAAGL